MNCDTIDSILDERAALLPQPQRQSVAAHIAACSRCADAWAAHEALAAESMGEPPADLWTRVVKRAAEAREVRAVVSRRAWLGAAGLAAAVAAAVFVGRVLVMPPAESTSSSSAEPVAASAPRFQEGTHYFEVASPALGADFGDGVFGGKVAVQEFFMYLCFPCYSFENELVRFDDLALERVPALFYGEAPLHARAFYTAEVLGKLDAMHAAFYDEVHERGNRLGSREALAEFFARYGVDAATFDAAFDSREVDARVRRAAALASEYDVTATPTLVVAGRYVTSPSFAGPDTLAVVEQLVAAEAERLRPNPFRP